MATLPPGQLTFGQIRDLALRRVGNTALVADAGTFLSQILFETYCGWEWPFLNQAATVTIVGATFPLPAGFLKSTDDRALSIATFDGANAFGQVVAEIDAFSMDAITQGADQVGMPRFWMADRNQGIGRVIPDPTGHQVVCSFRYKALPVAEVTPPPPGVPNANDTIVPAFPYHLWLVQALFVLLLQHETDPRADTEEMRRDKQMASIRQASNPIRSQQSIIPLDPEVFSPVFTDD